MTMNIEFHNPGPNDWEILNQVAAIDQAAFGLDGVSVFNLAQFARCRSIYCMKVDGKVVAETVVFKTNFDDGALIFGFAVLGESQGKGYGTALLEHVIKKCEELGIAYLELTANPENNAAMKLYVKNGGFRHFETLPPHPQHGQPRWLLRLDLKSAAV